VINDAQASAAPPVRGDNPDPPVRVPAPAIPGISIGADLAMAVIQRIFEGGLALESAASLLDGPLATAVLRALDGLDQLVHDIRSAVFAPRSRPVTSPPQHAH
jgi:hypothetical protein